MSHDNQAEYAELTDPAPAAGLPPDQLPAGSPAIDQLLAVAEARAQELEPFAREFARLRQVISLLRDPHGPQQIAHLDVISQAAQPSAAELAPSEPQPATATASGPAFKGRHGTRNGRDGRAPQGSNKQLIMRMIAQQPGINARGIADQTGLKRSVVNATISRLKRRGELLAAGGGLQVSPDAVSDDPLARTA